MSDDKDMMVKILTKLFRKLGNVHLERYGSKFGIQLTVKE